MPRKVQRYKRDELLRILEYECPEGLEAIMPWENSFIFKKGTTKDGKDMVMLRLGTFTNRSISDRGKGHEPLWVSMEWTKCAPSLIYRYGASASLLTAYEKQTFRERTVVDPLFKCYHLYMTGRNALFNHEVKALISFIFVWCNQLDDFVEGIFALESALEDLAIDKSITMNIGKDAALGKKRPLDVEDDESTTAKKTRTN